MSGCTLRVAHHTDIVFEGYRIAHCVDPYTKQGNQATRRKLAALRRSCNAWLLTAVSTQIVVGLYPFVLSLMILGLQAHPETLVAHMVAMDLLSPAGAEEYNMLVCLLFQSELCDVVHQYLCVIVCACF